MKQEKKQYHLLTPDREIEKEASKNKIEIEINMLEKKNKKIILFS